MHAFKCDRCGKLYEMKGMDATKLPPYQISEYLMVNQHGDCEYIKKDLCPDCTKALEEWFRSDGIVNIAIDDMFDNIAIDNVGYYVSQINPHQTRNITEPLNKK